MTGTLNEPLSLDEIKEVIFNTPGFFLFGGDAESAKPPIPPGDLRVELFGKTEDNLYADVNGIRMAYRDRGEGHPLVLLHGMRDTKHILEPLVDLLAPHVRVLSVDMRGHGFSDHPDAPYSTEQMARDVIGLLDSLGIDKAHLAGHSLGASVAFEAALIAPDRVNKIVAMGSSIREEKPEYRPVDPEKLLADKSPERHGPVLAMLNKRFFPMEGREVSQREIELLRAHVLLGWMMYPEATVRRLIKLQRTDLESNISALENEVLVLVGKLDVVGKVSDAENIKNRAKTFTIRVVDDAGHYMFLEKPDAAAEIIPAFLQSDAK